ncbi:MAG: zinc-binding dehydrogenase [Deltaproteobacteria bacterium]|nr:zinc-binding dehydrogenase [Deltaproteobacteria bacterium]
MKAVQIYEHGGADKLCYEDAPDPVLRSPRDVIVRLRAASLNHIDLWNRKGLTGMKVEFPHILGADGAGVVEEVGSEVTHARKGDAVCLYPPVGCGACDFCHTDRDFMCVRLRVLGEGMKGSYAEYVTIPGDNCFPIPEGYGFEDAAAFPLVFVTVWRMLVTNARLAPGEKVLILGIGGGVAIAALQIAKAMNAWVAVTSSSDEKLARAQSLGADYGLNYTQRDFTREIRDVTGKRGVDVVVDCVGGDSWAKSLASLVKGGRLVTCGATTGATPPTDIRRIFWNHLSIFGSTLGSREEFEQVLRFVEAAKVEPVIDRSFPLAEAAAAQTRLETGKQFGKIILLPG